MLKPFLGNSAIFFLRLHKTLELDNLPQTRELTEPLVRQPLLLVPSKMAVHLVPKNPKQHPDRAVP